MNRLLATVLLFAVALSATAAETIIVSIPANVDRPLESHYRDALAAALRARGEAVRTEVVVRGGRADIVTPTLAIEVERAHKWHEAIGQSLHYGDVLGISPAIAIIDADTLPAEQLAVLKALAAKYGIALIFLQKNSLKNN